MYASIACRSPLPDRQARQHPLLKKEKECMKRIISAVLALVLCLALFAGCGSSGSNSGGTLNVLFWSAPNQNQFDYWQSKAEAFNATKTEYNGKVIQVTVEMTPETDSSEAAIQNAIATGTVPAASENINSTFMRILAESSAIYELQDEPVYQQIVKDRVMGSTVDGWAIDGKQYVIPLYINSVCGVIIIGRFEEDYLEMIYRTDLPIVLVDHSSYHLPIDCVLTDNKSGVLESVSYLIREGYRKIGFFGDYSYSNSYKERFDGYLETMQKIYPDFQQLFAAISRFSVLEQIEDIVLRRDTVGIARILEKMEELPEAFQCANDRNAVLLNNALQLMGRKVPEDVAIVGFDDSDLATVMSPPLTTLHVSTVRMGNKAFSRLLWKMDHREASPERIMMGVRLIIRDST